MNKKNKLIWVLMFFVFKISYTQNVGDIPFSDQFDAVKTVDEFYNLSTKLINEAKDYIQENELSKSLNYCYFIEKELEKYVDSTSSKIIFLRLEYSNVIGIVSRRQKNYQKAIEFFNKSKKNAIILGDSLSLATILANIGNTFHSMGERDSAYTYHYRSLEIKKKQKNYQTLASSYMNLAVLFQKDSLYDKALDFYIKAKDIRISINDTLGLSRVYDNMGYMFFQQELHPESEIYEKKAIEFALRSDPMNLIVLRDAHEVLRDIYEIRCRDTLNSDSLRLAYSEKARIFDRKYDKYTAEVIERRNDKQINDLVVKYETAQAKAKAENLEKDNLILGNEKELLARENQLSLEREKNLENKNELLRTQNELSKKAAEVSMANEKAAKAELAEQETRAKYMLIIIFVVVTALIFLALLTLTVRKINRQLRVQKQELADKNCLLERQKGEIQKQKDVIEQKNKNIQQSLEYAQRIQNAILQPGILKEKFPPNVMFYKQKDTIGGDFYFAYHYEGESYLIVADCTGHGVPGAMVHMLMHNILTSTFLNSSKPSPNDILNLARDEVIAVLRQEYGEVKDGFDASVIKFKDHIEFAGAYNGMLAVLPDGHIDEVKADRMPVGIHHVRGNKDQASLGKFTNNVKHYPKGTRIYLMSDGYVDQFGGKKGYKYKKYRFKHLIQELQSLELEAIPARLEKDHLEWKNESNQEQIDDIIVVCIELDRDY